MRKRYETFYDKIAKLLTEERERRKLSKNQLAIQVGEQFNTIRSIESGRRFMAHHIGWIEELLGQSILEIYMQGEQSDKEINEEENIFY